MWNAVLAGILAGALLSVPALAQAGAALVERYCSGCHNPQARKGGLVLSGIDPAAAGDHPAVWEKVLRQMTSGQMPPLGMPRPNVAASAAFTQTLTAELDRAAAARPDPGRTMPHRLNRNEYSNAIRDLLGMDIEAGAALPVDESGNGFDNMANLLSMSPALLERYISAARKISLLAIGDLSAKPEDISYSSGVRGQRRAPDPEDLPLGASGGLLARHYFPLDAEYELKVLMTGGGNASGPQTPFKVRIPVSAGQHTLLATFAREESRPEAGTRTVGRVFGGGPANPAPALSPAAMDLRLDGAKSMRFPVPRRGNANPEVATLMISGPYLPTGKGNPPSRRRIFVCSAPDDNCARRILENLARRAFRRPVEESDVRPLLGFYKSARDEGADFDASIGRALRALLVSPEFLFRIERDPAGAPKGSVYRVSNHELASRLSFFLWSSIPDEELSGRADAGTLRDAATLRAQVQRMMEDPRAEDSILNFGGQWLYLRTLANTKPDADVFSGFDENLRRAFQRETELTLLSVFRENRSVLDLLAARYTFLNQRLAEHYKIPNVYGTHFRRVALENSVRGGLLGQGSILTVTSYPNRTSVVQRGKWILENLLGTPPPPAPADVPELPAKANDGRKLSLREAMETHRANAVCRSCHARMDPIGFSLENFDGVGAWREDDSGIPVDAKGTLPNGAEFQGPAGLKKLLLERHKEEFVETIAEKMLIYALGRGLEAKDRPVVRAIARKAASENYRTRAFIAAIVESVPFQMRRASDR